MLARRHIALVAWPLLAVLAAVVAGALVTLLATAVPGAPPVAAEPVETSRPVGPLAPAPAPAPGDLPAPAPVDPAAQEQAEMFDVVVSAVDGVLNEPLRLAATVLAVVVCSAAAWAAVLVVGAQRLFEERRRSVPVGLAAAVGLVAAAGLVATTGVGAEVTGDRMLAVAARGYGGLALAALVFPVADRLLGRRGATTSARAGVVTGEVAAARGPDGARPLREQLFASRPDRPGSGRDVGRS